MTENFDFNKKQNNNQIHSRDLVQDESNIDGDILKYIEKENQEDINNLKKEEEIYKNKTEIEDFNLNDKYVHDIVGVSDLKPMVVHVNIGNKTFVEKTIGIPGYYDEHSQTFFKLNGEPLDCVNFDEKFKHFLNSISAEING